MEIMQQVLQAGLKWDAPWSPRCDPMRIGLRLREVRMSRRSVRTQFALV